MTFDEAMRAFNKKLDINYVLIYLSLQLYALQLYVYILFIQIVIIFVSCFNKRSNNAGCAIA